MPKIVPIVVGDGEVDAVQARERSRSFRSFWQAMEQSSGFMGKSSSATYSLLIHCSELDRLADILGIITSQKNTTIRYIEWGYEEDTEAKNRWLALCIERANVKAQIIAASLRVTIL